MRDYSKEFADRVQYIRSLVETSGVDGIVFGNSGGKDSALVGILCKFACENTVGIMIPCATNAAVNNIAPRLRMTTLYAVAASEYRLVAGTGNRSERYMGYFTKWGDGSCDFNPISDLTATEIIEFLKWLTAPACIINKAPSAGLFDGQTDEDEMGVSYHAIDSYINGGEVSPTEKKIIDRYHRVSEHKRSGINVFKQIDE